MKRFAIMGVSGFVAPRHLQAIRDTGNILIAAMDISDSAGILDSYFPEAEFYTRVEPFHEFISGQKYTNGKVDYLTVCTPNHFHEEHISMGLSAGVSVICEKPMVLAPESAVNLLKMEKVYGRKVYNILQLRHHPAILKIRENKKGHKGQKSEIDLAYITPRGKWYHQSWKGDITKSGGISTNIGIHFFDMLIWIFGPVQNCQVQIHSAQRAAGYLELKEARVRWFLSIDENDLPVENREHKTALRTIGINGENIDFSTGFSNLHQLNYEAILKGEGYGIEEVLPSIELAHQIRSQVPGNTGEIHPLAKAILN